MLNDSNFKCILFSLENMRYRKSSVENNFQKGIFWFSDPELVIFIMFAGFLRNT